MCNCGRLCKKRQSEKSDVVYNYCSYYDRGRAIFTHFSVTNYRGQLLLCHFFSILVAIIFLLQELSKFLCRFFLSFFFVFIEMYATSFYYTFNGRSIDSIHYTHTLFFAGYLAVFISTCMYMYILLFCRVIKNYYCE